MVRSFSKISRGSGRWYQVDLSRDETSGKRELASWYRTDLSHTLQNSYHEAGLSYRYISENLEDLFSTFFSLSFPIFAHLDVIPSCSFPSILFHLFSFLISQFETRTYESIKNPRQSFRDFLILWNILIYISNMFSYKNCNFYLEIIKSCQ